MNAHAVNCAVVAGQGNAEKKVFDLSYGVFHGTAFCVAPSLFLAAAHVFRDARGDGKEVAVARLTPGDFHGVVVQDFELFENIDLALLQCPGLRAEILPFNFAPLGFFADVFAVGFAFGFEPPKFHLRAFKGHVVNRRALNSLSGEPPGYELSFLPPPGLSGAPLLTTAPDGSFVVTGMILQEYIAEFRERKMELGLALDIEELLTLNSRILGGSVAERLFRRQRILRGTDT